MVDLPALHLIGRLVQRSGEWNPLSVPLDSFTGDRDRKLRIAATNVLESRQAASGWNSRLWKKTLRGLSVGVAYARGNEVARCSTGGVDFVFKRNGHWHTGWKGLPFFIPGC